ncbi:MAG: 3-isopropylmalate dehydrogenase [Muribaculaceae bacterium]|nr:3-isopropylmalate dehydrogenase [Muribaculaceae bacterium]
MKLKIAVLPGDGIGPEISRVGVEVMKAVAKRFDHQFEFEYGLAGAAAIRATGNPFPEETLSLCKNSDAVLFSAVGDPEYDNNPDAKVRPEQGLLAMRKQLGLFANIRPIQTFPALVDKSPLRAEIVRDADFVCVRELTGGMYFGEKFESDDKAYDTNLYTRPEIERILRVAFELASRRRRHVTVVDKANVLASSRLWRKIAKEMESEWQDVTTDYMFVDNAAMKMLQDPCFFDVIVTENTFGDILTDEASVISGSMGLLPSSSVGESTPVFEPIHGSWPQAAGMDIANPLAQILSVAMLLEHFGLEEEGRTVRDAVDASIRERVVTPDLGEGGKSEFGTRAVGKWISDLICSDAV